MKSLLVSLFLFLNFQAFANNELQEAKNKLENLKKEYDNLYAQASDLDKAIRLEKRFNKVYEKFYESIQLPDYDYQEINKDLTKVFRDRDFHKIANEIFSDPKFNPEYDKEIFSKILENSQAKLKRYYLVRNDPKFDEHRFHLISIILGIEGENGGFKNQIYFDIYAFTFNYQRRLKSLTPGSQEYEDLRRSFIWGKNIFLKWAKGPSKFFHKVRDHLKNYLDSVEPGEFAVTGSYDKSGRNFCEINCGGWRDGEPKPGRGGLNGPRELKPIPGTKPGSIGLEGMLNRAGRNIDLRGNGQIVTNNENPYENELAQIKKEIDKYSTFISERKNEIQENLKNLAHIEERVESHRHKFEDSIISDFINNFTLQSLIGDPLITMFAIAGWQSVEDNPEKTDLLFSVFLDTPYDLANLFTAVAYDQTIFGEDASEVSDKVILGALALIPGISHKVAKEGIDFAKRMKKFGMEGLEKIAAKSSVKSVDEIIKVAEELGIEGADEIAKNAKLLEHVEPNFKVSKVEDGLEVNNRDFIGNGLEPAYKDSVKAIEFGRTQPMEQGKYVRVSGADNIARPWYTEAKEIEGLNPDQIRAKFNLIEKPVVISDVNIPIGTPERIGLVGTNKFGNGEGAIQIEILLKKVPEGWFVNTRSL